MKEFLKTTLIGGALFLLPVALVLAILSHAMRLAVKAALPVSHALHFDQIGKVAGIGIVTVVAVGFIDPGVVPRRHRRANQSRLSD
ncbi:hypothetical protein [Bradyrhizobium sp. USDA 4508]